MKRRGFLGSLAAGAAAMPSALKGASGMRAGSSLGVPIAGYAGEAAKAAYDPISETTMLQGRVAKMAAMRAVGIPSGLREYVSSNQPMGGYYGPMNFPPDIAALRSVSTVSKARMAREREEERSWQNWLESPARQLRHHLLRKQFGDWL